MIRRFLRNRKRFFGQEETEGYINFHSVEYVFYKPENKYVFMRDWKDDEYHLGPGYDTPVEQVLMEGDFKGYVHVGYPIYPTSEPVRYISFYYENYFFVQYNKVNGKLYIKPEEELM